MRTWGGGGGGGGLYLNPSFIIDFLRTTLSPLRRRTRSGWGNTGQRGRCLACGTRTSSCSSSPLHRFGKVSFHFSILCQHIYMPSEFSCCCCCIVGPTASYGEGRTAVSSLKYLKGAFARRGSKRNTTHSTVTMALTASSLLVFS